MKKDLIIKRYCSGTVVQIYKNGELVEQEFVAGDQDKYTNEQGDTLDYSEYYEDLDYPMEMKNPHNS